MKIIVNILSAQTVPNYLFTKEFYTVGDRILFISSNNANYKQGSEWICNLLKIDNAMIDTIIFKNKDDENNLHSMIQQLDEAIKEKKGNHDYLVNLTGGTKLMMLAAKNVFEQLKSKFYYIPIPQNTIFSIDENDNSIIPIKERLTVSDFLKLYGKPHTEGCSVIKDKKYNESMFNWFFNGMSDDDKDILNLLRAGRSNEKKEYPRNGGYRNSNIDLTLISEKKETISANGTCAKPRIEGLINFLDRIGFQTNKENKLSAQEIQYLTGGWFEEYVYHFVKENIQPNDIQLGVKVGERNGRNEIDVLFTKGNKLYTIECKTGLLGVKLNDIAYKISAVINSIGALSVKTAFLALDHMGNPNEINMFKDMAKAMKVEYEGTSTIKDNEQFTIFLKKFTQNSFD